ncbi:MAG: hypothetical protein ABFD90_16000 [Phycisphaerales bacterium]
MRDVRAECTLEQYTEFMHCVTEAGIKTGPWYEVTPYDGPEKRLPATFHVKRTLLSKKHILGADNHEDIETIASYVKNNPECHHWRVDMDTGPWNLEAGHFVIVEISAFRGGDRRPVIELLQGFGLDQEVIDNTLNDKSEQLLGYILSSNADEAQQLAKIIEVGANRRSDGHLPLAARVAFFEETARYMPATSECTSGRIVRLHGLAGTREQLARRFEEAYQLKRSYEPLWELLSQATVNRLVDKIMDSAVLDADGKAEACLALIASLDGCIPPPEGILRLEYVCGSETAGLLRAAKVRVSP